MYCQKENYYEPINNTYSGTSSILNNQFVKCLILMLLTLLHAKFQVHVKIVRCSGLTLIKFWQNYRFKRCCENLEKCLFVFEMSS